MKLRIESLCQFVYSLPGSSWEAQNSCDFLMMPNESNSFSPTLPTPHLLRPPEVGKKCSQLSGRGFQHVSAMSCHGQLSGKIRIQWRKYMIFQDNNRVPPPTKEGSHLSKRVCALEKHVSSGTISVLVGRAVKGMTKLGFPWFSLNAKCKLMSDFVHCWSAAAKTAWPQDERAAATAQSSLMHRHTVYER